MSLLLCVGLDAVSPLAAMYESLKPFRKDMNDAGMIVHSVIKDCLSISDEAMRRIRSSANSIEKYSILESAYEKCQRIYAERFMKWDDAWAGIFRMAVDNLDAQDKTQMMRAKEGQMRTWKKTDVWVKQGKGDTWRRLDVAVKMRTGNY